MLLIKIALVFAALWCGGSWLFLAYVGIRKRVDVEQSTFRLGICFVLSVGFLGLILSNGG